MFHLGIGGVIGEAVRAVDAGAGALDHVGNQGDGRPEVARPAQPAGVTNVNVGVDVLDRVQFGQRVGDTALVERLLVDGSAVRVVQVGDQVGQRIRLDDRDDAQA